MPEAKTVHLPRSRALPYVNAESGMELKLRSCLLDSGEEVPLTARSRFVDLKKWTDWKNVRVVGSVTLNDAVVEAVFPPEERAAPPAKLLVLIGCLPTILRYGHTVCPGPTRSGEHNFEIPLARKDLRGAVTLEARLVRLGTVESNMGPYASEDLVQLATTDAVEIEIDEPEVRKGFLVIQWKELEENLVYRLDTTDPTKPVLFLNSRHPALYRVLHSPGTTGREARIRDLVFSQIFYGVWTQLIHRTAADIGEDCQVRQDWQKGVLRFVGEALYPDVSTVEEIAEALKRDLETRDGIAAFAERLDLALQRDTEFSNRVNHLALEGKDV